MHWLADHTPKSFKNRFSKFGRLNFQNTEEEAKIMFKLLFLNPPRFLIKNTKSTIQYRKLLNVAYI